MIDSVFKIRIVCHMSYLKILSGILLKFPCDNHYSILTTSIANLHRRVQQFNFIKHVNEVTYFQVYFAIDTSI